MRGAGRVCIVGVRRELAAEGLVVLVVVVVVVAECVKAALWQQAAAALAAGPDGLRILGILRIVSCAESNLPNASPRFFFFLENTVVPRIIKGSEDFLSVVQTPSP